MNKTCLVLLKVLYSLINSFFRIINYKSYVLYNHIKFMFSIILNIDITVTEQFNFSEYLLFNVFLI